MIKLTEKEAKTKVCPIVREKCVGSKCMSWRFEQYSEKDFIKIKIETRLQPLEKEKYKEAIIQAEKYLDVERGKYNSDVTLKEIIEHIRKDDIYLNKILEKLEPETTNNEITEEEKELFRGYCILLKDNENHGK